jgi:hypothetical protein
MLYHSHADVGEGLEKRVKLVGLKIVAAND